MMERMLRAMACLMSIPRSVRAGMRITPPPMPVMAPTNPARRDVGSNQWKGIIVT